MGEIYLVRHGQASFAQKNYDQLSSLGEQQGRALGRYWQDLGVLPDAVYSGTMQRHKQTAEAVLSELNINLPVHAHAGFNEYDGDDITRHYLPLISKAEQEIAALADKDLSHPKNYLPIFRRMLQAWIHEYDDHYPYSYSWEAFAKEKVAALHHAVAKAGPSKRIMIFSSGGPITAMIQRLWSLPKTEVFNVNAQLVNAAVTKLYYRSDTLSLHFVNNYAHLQMPGNPRLITYI